MKENKIDILFKKKLHGLEQPPRPIAWDKINSQITKDKVVIGWWHKAAVIVLLCLSGLLISYKKDGLNNGPLKTFSDSKDKNTLYPIQDKTIENNSHHNNKDSNTPYIAKLHADTLKEEISSSIKPNNHREKTTKDLIAKADAATPVSDQYKHKGKGNSKHQSNQSSTADDSIFKEEAALPIKDTPPITIEFKSRKRPVEKAMLADNNSEDLREEHVSTLKKLMTKVKDIKEGEISLADIRQAKDNLFALDTYKETLKNNDK